MIIFKKYHTNQVEIPVAVWAAVLMLTLIDLSILAAAVKVTHTVKLPTSSETLIDEFPRVTLTTATMNKKKKDNLYLKKFFFNVVFGLVIANIYSFITGSATQQVMLVFKSMQVFHCRLILSGYGVVNPDNFEKYSSEKTHI